MLRTVGCSGFALIVSREVNEVDLFLPSGQLHYCATLPHPDIPFTGRTGWRQGGVRKGAETPEMISFSRGECVPLCKVGFLGTPENG